MNEMNKGFPLVLCYMSPTTFMCGWGEVYFYISVHSHRSVTRDGINFHEHKMSDSSSFS